VEWEVVLGPEVSTSRQVAEAVPSNLAIPKIYSQNLREAEASEERWTTCLEVVGGVGRVGR